MDETLSDFGAMLLNSKVDDGAGNPESANAINLVRCTYICQG